mgnify:CR=1 FL=1
MSKKETLSKAELQKMTGLDFSEQNSQTEESRKKSIDAALENFSIENIKPHPLPSELKQAQTEAAPPVTEDVDEVPPTNVTEEEPSAPTIQRRVSSKQRKLSLEEYRNAYLKVPTIIDRKPVFVSCEVRDRLEDYVRKLGGRKMSVSGLLENIARQHLDTYDADFEQWRKL